MLILILSFIFVTDGNTGWLSDDDDLGGGSDRESRIGTLSAVAAPDA